MPIPYVNRRNAVLVSGVPGQAGMEFDLLRSIIDPTLFDTEEDVGQHMVAHLKGTYKGVTVWFSEDRNGYHNVWLGVEDRPDIVAELRGIVGYKSPRPRLREY